MNPDFTKAVKNKKMGKGNGNRQCLFSSKCYAKYFPCKRKVNPTVKLSQ